MTGNLTGRQIESYRTDGFLFPVRVSEPQGASRWRGELEELERSHGTLHYLPKAHLVLPLADRLARDSAVLDAVESLLGPDILLWDSTFIIKEPGSGKKVSWHQDLTYWGLDPQDVVSIWLALSPASVQSGCMRMISGTQDGPLMAHQENTASDNLLSRGQTIAGTIDERIAVDVVLAPGEMSLHHGRVWHGSNPNISADRRIGFNAQYLAPWVRQVVGDWDSALLARGHDRFGHFEAESPPTGAFVPQEVSRQQSIAARRGAYLNAGTG
jgi:ectoine hydroxylase-related dioxygenase (phytanoyl-CoA dioxygenase family)